MSNSISRCIFSHVLALREAFAFAYNTFLFSVFNSVFPVCISFFVTFIVSSSTLDCFPYFYVDLPHWYGEQVRLLGRFRCLRHD